MKPGQVTYHAGVAAEKIAALDYASRGYVLPHERWRGAGGEIDLIFRDAEGLVFVEVKKSRSHARASQRISATQMQRIYSAAEEFLASQPSGQLTNVRFDVALIDGLGVLQIIENAFGQG